MRNHFIYKFMSVLLPMVGAGLALTLFYIMLTAHHTSDIIGFGIFAFLVAASTYLGWRLNFPRIKTGTVLEKHTWEYEDYHVPGKNAMASGSIPKSGSQMVKVYSCTLCINAKKSAYTCEPYIYEKLQKGKIYQFGFAGRYVVKARPLKQKNNKKY